MFGNDGKAEHLKWALTRKTFTLSAPHDVRAQRFAGVRLIDGDRKFVGGPRNTAQHVARTA